MDATPFLRTTAARRKNSVDPIRAISLRTTITKPSCAYAQERRAGRTRANAGCALPARRPRGRAPDHSAEGAIDWILIGFFAINRGFANVSFIMFEEMAGSYATSTRGTVIMRSEHPFTKEAT